MKTLGTYREAEHAGIVAASYDQVALLCDQGQLLSAWGKGTVKDGHIILFLGTAFAKRVGTDIWDTAFKNAYNSCATQPRLGSSEAPYTALDTSCLLD